MAKIIDKKSSITVMQVCTIKSIYDLWKETIEIIFGVAKENHSMWYTQQIGTEKIAMKIGLTFACLNMKKLAKILTRKSKKHWDFSTIFSFF